MSHKEHSNNRAFPHLDAAVQRHMQNNETLTEEELAAKNVKLNDLVEKFKTLDPAAEELMLMYRAIFALNPPPKE